VSFNASLKFLKEEEIDFFACLSVCDADSFALHSAAVAGGCPEQIAGEQLEYLYRLSLVNRPEEATSTRFVFHPLLRAFASELAEERGVFDSATGRHAEHFIDLVKTLGKGDVAASNTISEDIGETLTAAKWLIRRSEADYNYLICLEPILVRFGHWREAANLMAQFLTLAETAGDTEAVVQIRIQQVKFLLFSGDFQEAVNVLQPVVAALEEGSSLSQRVQSMFLNTYGGVLHRLGKFPEAADALAKAGDIEQRLGNERGQAMVLNSLGRSAAAVGQISGGRRRVGALQDDLRANG
jgi:tetratricopeptide (TPR) repeat protein